VDGRNPAPWMVKPLDNGINHVSTSAGCRNHPQHQVYVDDFLNGAIHHDLLIFMDCFKGKSTGNHEFFHELWRFPVKMFP
jgi:hypothetical protein